MKRITVLLGLITVLVFNTGQSAGDQTALHLLQEAQNLFDSAQYEQALARGQAALARFPATEPEAGECLLLLGNAFLETGQWETALEQYQAALAIFRVNPGPTSLQAAQAFNNTGEYFYKKGDYIQAETEHRKALHIRETQRTAAPLLVADSYNNLGNCRAGRGDYPGAKALHEKALAIRQKYLPSLHPDLGTSFNNLGNCAYLSGDYPTALEQFQKALHIRQAAFGPESLQSAQVYNNLGNVYAALGARSAAILQFEHALQIRRQRFGEKHPAVASAVENVADLQFDNGDYIAALDFYRQAYAIQCAIRGEKTAAAASLWHKIGLCYQYEGDYEQALRHHLAAEPVLTASLGLQHPFIAGLYNNLGNCFAGKKNYARAIAYYEKALGIFQQNRENQWGSLALVLNNLGTASLKQKRVEQALNYFQQGLGALEQGRLEALPEFALYLKNKGLALERLGRWPEAGAVFEQALHAPGASDPLTNMELRGAWGTLLCQRGIRTADSALLHQSIDALDLALQRSDSLRLRLSAPASRQRWIDTQFPALLSAIEACYHAWKLTGRAELLEHAFALAEQNKSLQLLEHLRGEKASHFAGVPDSLLEAERQLGETLNRQEKEYLAWSGKKDSARVRVAETGISETRRALGDLLAHLEKTYPAYYRLRFQQQTATPALLRRQLLQPDQALLEYTVSDSAVFVFVLTQTDFKCLRIVLPAPLNASVAALRHSLQAYPEATGSEAESLGKAYADRACQLYNTLFAPVQAAGSLPERLLIVPDGALAYLPFECLLSAAPADYRQYKNLAYLVRKYRISYAYSATQQLELLQTPRREAAEKLLAIAPVYRPNRYGLRALRNNLAEARAVRDLFNGDLLEDTTANARTFLEKAPRYGVLLCAMHGQASSAVGDLSYLAFGAGADSSVSPFLFARDLYYQSIPAELVVLSACETSVGEYRLGQGVISLARGFFQAGARSVVATLWSVDDARNAELIRFFFQGLKSGLPKDEALRQAKLRFLRAHPHDEAHPVYWAGVTAYGDMERLKMAGPNWGFRALWALILLITGYFLIRRLARLKKTIK